MKRWSISSIPTKYLLFGLLILTAVVAALSICVGAVWLMPGQVLSALLSGGDSTAASIIWYTRIPRTCGCLLVGAALAVSGAIIQSVLANPLAAPNIIGVNSGAGLMVAISCAAAPAAVEFVPLVAFLGALAGVFLVMFLARRTGASRMTLVLAGVAVSSVFSAGIDGVITFVPEALNGYSDFRIGGFFNLTMERVVPAFWVILIGLIVAFSMAEELDVLMLGQDTARSLGLAVGRVQLVYLTAAAALAGAAVSVAGLLGFVGLIVPHIMRRLVGEESRPLLAACALGGAVLLTASDLLARILFVPYELPVGIVLALVGGPFFLWLLLRQRGGRRG